MPTVLVYSEHFTIILGVIVPDMNLPNTFNPKVLCHISSVPSELNKTRILFPAVLLVINDISVVHKLGNILTVRITGSDEGLVLR